MNVTFPIKFKYYRIEPGVVSPETTTDLPKDGYVVLDTRDKYVTGSTNLAALVAYVVGRDIMAEETQQFLDRKLPGFTHLNDIDIDRRPEVGAGIMIPAHLASGGGGSSNGGMH